MIEFKSVTKNYGKTIALNDFSITIQQHGIYCLLGRNGAGKTTMLKTRPVAAFFQMWAFLTLFCCFLHTLTLIQGHWYGWVTDVLLIAVISVFTPIAPLRAALVWFFNMIIFHDFAIVQILSCLILGAAVYSASLIPIKSKQI